MRCEPLQLDLELTRDAFTLSVQATVPAEGVTALTGPSGAGKSTLLRLIVGLEAPRRGTIRMGPDCWTDTSTNRWLAARQRPVGLMFQDNRLFPHLTVNGNLAFADRRRADPDTGPQWDEIVAALDLAPLLSRRIDELSGGEQRRAALGQALLTGPRLLLLDEPLVGLDRARKRTALAYIERVHRQFSLPMLYVSHDMADIARLADSLWVMDAGKLTEMGPADEVLARWGGIGHGNDGARLIATVIGHEARLGLTRVTAGGVALDTPHDPSLREGQEVRLWVRANDVALATERPTGISIRNALPATIEAIKADAASTDVLIELKAGAQLLQARISRASLIDLGFEPGQTVFALLKTIRLEDGGL